MCFPHAIGLTAWHLKLSLVSLVLSHYVYGLVTFYLWTDFYQTVYVPFNKHNQNLMLVNNLLVVSSLTL